MKHLPKTQGWLLLGTGAAITLLLSSCGSSEKVQATNLPDSGVVSVGVVKIGRKSLGRQLTLSSELVPYQEIEVYAKEAGYVNDIRVDYGSHVQAGEVMATLTIPELQDQVQQDDGAIKTAQNQITHAQNEVSRAQANYQALHNRYQRLSNVAKENPKMVAQQEVDDAQGNDNSAQAQVDAAQSNLEVAQSQVIQAEQKKKHDQDLFEYTKITAPFSGVVTQRYANKGTLMQAGTNSSTQAMPLVRLSEDDKFRLVIPVPESYVRYIRPGDRVNVLVPSLNQTFPGTVARSALDVKEETRTMHTEVDVLNTSRALVPGLYAEATLSLEQKGNALAVPLQALSRQNDQAAVLVVNSANKIETRNVSIGVQTDTDAEVISGLAEGDSVIVSDRSGLKAGQEVRPQEVQLQQYHQEDQK
jgi:RND family efflux transporter MFP subunit